MWLASSALLGRRRVGNVVLMEDAARSRPSRVHCETTPVGLLACLLAVDAVSQEPTPVPAPKPAAALQARADEPNALATEAEALVKNGDMAAARAVCQRALKMADLPNASDAWLAEASNAPWKISQRHLKSETRKERTNRTEQFIGIALRSGPTSTKTSMQTAWPSTPASTRSTPYSASVNQVSGTS